MKLLAKYNRANSIATIIALSISGVFYYFFIRYQLIEQLDKDLRIEQLEIADYVILNKNIPNASNYKDQSISFELANDPLPKRKFSSRKIFNRKEKEYEAIREITFPIEVQGKKYRVTVSKSQQETDDLIQLILLITFVTVLILLVSLSFINHFLFGKLWRPFASTLQQLTLFNLTAKQELRLEKTDIDEFADLNNAVKIMSSRVSKDYEAIKSFTENASHEIQTPIAIIQSKLELLIQSENLQPDQARNIQSIYDASIRLSKLNQSLILLTKIDNQQFQEKEKVNISDLLHRQLGNYEELISIKQIKVQTYFETESIVAMNEVMAEILFSNLLINAIKHNTENGRIDISLNKQRLIFSNSGADLKTDPKVLFERFKKNDQESASLGLGLSIVKKICEQYGFSIFYRFENLVHTITVQFNVPY